MTTIWLTANTTFQTVLYLQLTSRRICHSPSGVLIQFLFHSIVTLFTSLQCQVTCGTPSVRVADATCKTAKASTDCIKLISSSSPDIALNSHSTCTELDALNKVHNRKKSQDIILALGMRQEQRVKGEESAVMWVFSLFCQIPCIFMPSKVVTDTNFPPSTFLRVRKYYMYLCCLARGSMITTRRRDDKGAEINFGWNNLFVFLMFGSLLAN